MATIDIMNTADVIATVTKEAQDALVEIRREFNTLTVERDDYKKKLEQAETLVDNYRIMFSQVSERVKSLERDRRILIHNLEQYIAPQYSYDSIRLNHIVNELGGIMFTAEKLYLNPIQLEEWTNGESVPPFEVLKQIYDLYYQETNKPDKTTVEE